MMADFRLEPVEFDPFESGSAMSAGGGSLALEPVDFDPFETGLSRFRETISAPTQVFSNLAAGIGESILGLIGGTARFVGTTSEAVGDYLERKVPLGGFETRPADQWREGEMPVRYKQFSEQDIDAKGVQAVTDEIAGLIDRGKGSLGYEPGTTWEDVKSSPLKSFIPFALEQGLVSVPDMIATIRNLPAYMAARTGEIGQSRAENDLRDNATVEDFLVSAPAAVASSLLERLGARGVFGLDDAAVESIKQLTRETAKAAGKEAGTEALQEGIESVAETAGTKRGFDIGDTAERMAAGALAGGVFGGTLRGAEGTAELASLREQRRQQQAQQEVAPDATEDAPARAPTVSQQPDADLLETLVPSTPAPVSEVERPNSPRLTAEDRTSPLPDAIIDDGKAMMEATLAGKPVAAIGGGSPETRTEQARIVTRPQDTERSPATGRLDGDAGTGTGDGVVSGELPGAAPAARLTLEPVESNPFATVTQPAPATQELPAASAAPETASSPVTATPEAGQSTMMDRMRRDPASWVIRNRETGETVMETFDRRAVEALNTDKYEAVPIIDYLTGFNRAVKERGGVQPTQQEVTAAIEANRREDGAATVPEVVAPQIDTPTQAEPMPARRLPTAAQTEVKGRKGRHRLVLTKTGEDVFPGETFKTPMEARTALKQARAEQRAARPAAPKTRAEKLRVLKRPAASAIMARGGIDPDSPIARELKTRDITPRTFPGLFRKGGLRALDNIPRVEENLFRGGQGNFSTDVGNERTYIAPDEWVSALESEMAGAPLRTADEVAAEQAKAGPSGREIDREAEFTRIMPMVEREFLDNGFAAVPDEMRSLVTDQVNAGYTGQEAIDRAIDQHFRTDQSYDEAIDRLSDEDIAELLGEPYVRPTAPDIGSEIPFEGDANALDAENARIDGERARTGDAREARANDGQDQDGARVSSQASTERGADGRPQLTLGDDFAPDQVGLARLRADAPLRGRANQRPMDEGLFGDESQQTDLVDMARQNQPPQFSPAPAPDSEAFKRWFGNSKVVDANGNPLVVYHGTTVGDFETFQRQSSGNGFYFSPSPRLASTYAGGSRRAKGGSVYPVYLSIRNPKIIGSGVLGPDMKSGTFDEEALSSAFITDAQMAALQEQGIDGIINYETREIVAFSPNQIKSVNNRGKFDPYDNRILYESEQLFDTPERPLEERPNYIPIGDFKPNSRSPLGNQAKDFVTKRGRATGVEHLVAIAANGRVLEQSKGAKNNVQFSPALERAMADPANAIVVHHNHPSSRSFSPADLVILAGHGVSGIYAHGHNGDVHFASITPEFKSVLLALPQGRAFNAMQRLVQDAHSLVYKALAYQLKAGRINVEQANHFHSLVMTDWLNKAGIINAEIPYNGELNDLNMFLLEQRESLKMLRNRADLIKEMADEKVDTNDRYARTLRDHPGRVDKVSGRGSRSPGQKSRQGGPTLFGEGNDPAQARGAGGLAEPADAFERARTQPSRTFGLRLSQAMTRAAAAMKSRMPGERQTAGDGETMGDFLHRKWVDYLQPVATMQRALANGEADIADVEDVYLNARLAEDRALADIQNIHDRRVTPMVEKLVKTGNTLEDFHKFLYARHAEERNEVVGARNPQDSDLYKAVKDHDIKGASGISTNEAKATLAGFRKDLKKYQGLIAAEREMRAMLDESLDAQYQAGLLDRDTYTLLRERWKHYVPLKGGDGQDADGFWSPVSAGGFDVRGDEFKAALGRFTEAENVIAHAVSQAEHSVLRQKKNDVGKAALRLINRFDPEGKSLGEVYWTEEPGFGSILKAKEVYKRVLKDGKVESVKKPNNFSRLDDVLATKVGGKTFYIRFADPKVGHAIRKISAIEMGTVTSLVRNVSVLQSFINTRANPAFVPINLIRDVQTGAVLLMADDFSAREIGKTVANIPKAWGAMWRKARGWENRDTSWDKWADEFNANGGKITFDGYADFERSLKRLQSEMQAGTRSSGDPRNTWRKFVSFIESLNDAAENGIRLSSYVTARQKGMSAPRAAFLSRDLTVDFKKRGEFGPTMNAWYVFFNAALQGNYNIAKKMAKSRKVQAAVSAFMFGGMLQHMWNSLMAGDDDDGENAYYKMLKNEGYKLERQMVFFLPGSKDYVSFPLAYGFNAFWHLGVQGGALTEGIKDPGEVLLDSFRVAFDAFNPIGSGSVLSMIAPTVADPIVDLATNKNFAGAPIYPEGNPFDASPPPESQQAFRSTGQHWKWAADSLNTITGGTKVEPGLIDVYPDTLEYLWGWFTGGIGRFVGQTVDTGVRGVQGEFEPKKTPYVRSFYGRIDEDSQRSEYFKIREAVLEAEGYMRDYTERGDDANIGSLQERAAAELETVAAVKTAEKQRRAMNKVRRGIEADSDLSKEERETRLEELEKQELAIMLEVRKVYREAWFRSRGFDTD